MQAEKILTSSEKFHIELGLKRIARILELLGNPQNALKCIHIAGSNGKGSTCAILEEIFTKAGYKTGKFTSPHLFSYTERITVNKHSIRDTDFDNLIEKISKIDKEHKIGLTEFEILTAAGFLYFKENACDIVILETGLGGRLDSTNIIASPLASIITSISLEHKERLGDTIEKITYEKAGIIKKGCPVIFLDTNMGYNTIKQEAKAKGGVPYETKAIEIQGNYCIINGEKCEFGLRGQHQGENLALALKAVDILNKNGAIKIDFNIIKEALKAAKWRFRLEHIQYNDTEILIDACHNPDGARVLRKYLDENYEGKKIKFIFGCLKNKDYKSVLENLLFCDSKIDKNKQLCFFEFNYPNALKYDALPDKFKTIAKKITDPIGEMTDGACDLVVVAGSIYMLGLIFKDFDFDKKQAYFTQE